MIKCVNRDDLDVKKWDHCIKTALNARLYAMSFYLDSVCTEGTWKGLILDDYKAVMPLPINKRIPLFPRIMLPHFAQQLGVFSSEKVTSELSKKFVSAIPNSFKSVYLQFNDQNEMPMMEGIVINQRDNFLLTLKGDHDSLFKNYSKTHRRNIRLAAKYKPSVEIIGMKEFIPFYLKHDKADYLSKEKSKEILETLLPKVLDEKFAKIYALRDQNKSLLAACVILSFKQRLTYLMAASSDLGREKRAMHFLIDHIISTNLTESKILDFEGSDIENLARFFGSFGAQKTKYSLLKFNRFPFSLFKS